MEQSKHLNGTLTVSWGKQGGANSCRVKVASFHLSSICLTANCMQLGIHPGLTHLGAIARVLSQTR